MKKQSLLLMAGAILTIASCNTAPNNQYTEAQIDSMVNARVDELRTQMMASNDSMINALAAQRADSIIAAMKGASSVTTSTHTTHTTTVKTPVTPPKAPSPIGPKSNTDRPGATNTGGIKTNTDRPGATNTGGVKTNSDRPGATKVK